MTESGSVPPAAAAPTAALSPANTPLRAATDSASALRCGGDPGLPPSRKGPRVGDAFSSARRAEAERRRPGCAPAGEASRLSRPCAAG